MLFLTRFLLAFTMFFAVSAHAWTTLESWETTDAPESRTGDATYNYVTESVTTSFIDSDGNTVERLSNIRYRIETRIITTSVTHRPRVREQNSLGRIRERGLDVYATVTTRTDIQKNHMGTTIVSETIVAEAPVDEAELARIAEEERLAEVARLAEIARLEAEEEARLAEIARLEAEEEARLAEVARLEAIAEEERLAEEARLLAIAEEEARVAEEERLAALAEEERLAEEARLLAIAEEEARLAELARIEAEEAEALRLAEELALAEAEAPATLDFGDNSIYLGTPTEMPSSDPTYYQGLSNFKDHNSIVGQDWALSRGWTGKGSTIGILDSGVDIDHPELVGKVKYQWEPGYDNGIEDSVGHGSHVASIAAGNMGGDVMGIAPDANLAIVKITDSWSASMSFARQGITYLKNNTDAVVANLSANTNYHSSYTSSVTNRGNGVFTSNHEYYGGTNYYNMETPESWGSAMSGSEIVLTISAGNQSNDYVQNPATFAVATDSSGNLVMDGRAIVVGAWNPSTNTINGARSGHICKNYSGSECLDRYRTSDFYILAPGSNIYGAYKDGTYRAMTGTSQAAPVVAGAVAVIHQMWPYMKGENIVQVLLDTADKTITGYNVNTHGQGLLDLKRATEPIGSLGISMTGRTGTTTPLSGGIAVAGISDITELSSVKVVDEIGRDYTVDLSSATLDLDKGNTSLIPVYQLDHSVGSSWSSKFVGGEGANYRGWYLNAYQQDLGEDTFSAMSVGFDSSAMTPRNRYTGQIDDPSDWTDRFTYTRSYGSPFMSFSGMWGQVNSTDTFEYSKMYKPNNFYAQLGIMYSITDFDSGLVEDVDNITSMYGVAGWANDNLNLYVGVKPTVIDGSVDIRVPTSVSSTGVMSYTNARADMTGDPISYVGAQYNLTNSEDNFGNVHNLRLNGAVDQNNQYQVGAFYEFTF